MTNKHELKMKQLQKYKNNGHCYKKKSARQKSRPTQSNGYCEEVKTS